MRPRERPRGGPTDNRFVVESAGARTFRCVSRIATLDLGPRRPTCCATRFTEVMQGPAVPISRRDGVSSGLLWACDRLPISATHIRRAGTPASRESSSARGSHPCPRWDLAYAVRPLSRFRGERPATSFSRTGCLHPMRVVPSLAVASHRPRRARPGQSPGSGREMTQGAMPSVDPLRVPLAGASPLSRRGRRAW
jgi:hypothetical protein